MTITDAIKQVMGANRSPMTASEAYQAIVAASLYAFHADNPAHVVRSQIRRHCQGLDFPSAAPTKHFKLVGENRYALLDHPVRQVRKVSERKAEGVIYTSKSQSTNILRELQTLYGRYIAEFKKKILLDLKLLSPSAFEAFAKRLLDVYGFYETRITQVSCDGGIDGYGKLNVGLANLNVAFQCKRWTKRNIQRPEIDRFRGAIQGDFEQGLFFTTASFSEGAINASIKKGFLSKICG